MLGKGNLHLALSWFIIGIFFSSTVESILTLPQFFGNNMVLQSSPFNPKIWGKSDPNNDIKVGVDGQTLVITKASSSSGSWMAVLPPFPDGGPHQVSISNIQTNETIVMKNVLFGDVWLCSGQSNMEMNVYLAYNETEEVADSINYPLLRVFSVEKMASEVPLDDVKSRSPGLWEVSSPTSIGNQVGYSYFSATCYFFGRENFRKTNKPIGLISSCWGGTLIEAWSSKDALSQCSSKDRTQLNNPDIPSSLWNGMIHPLLPLSLKGALWYQGESNIDDPAGYECEFPAMIQDWRKKFENQDLSFYFVQLAPYQAQGRLARMRQAQMAALTLPKVGMATAFDLWDPDSPTGEIHPRNKQTVGQRLSLNSQFYDYGKPVDFTGPKLYSSSTSQQGAYWQTILNFSSSTDLTIEGTEKCTICCQRDAFELQRADNGEWERPSSPSTTTGKRVGIISSFRPISVRYAWEDIPQCALFDLNHLVAIPFMDSLGLVQ